MFHSEKEIIVINLKCNSMKKILSLLLAASAMSLQAQTLLVNDFENGLGGAYVAVDGSCEVIGNPSINDGNNSANVLKITSTNFAQVGFPVSLPNGKTLNDYAGIRFQAAILPGNDPSKIHWIGFNVGVSDNKESMDLIDPESGNGTAWGDGVELKWVDVELLFNETLLAEKLTTYTSDERNVMIKLGRAEFIYAVDNIRLIEKEIKDPNAIFTFETMDLGVSNRCQMPWAGSCEIVENPYKTGINTSDKCLHIVNPECSPVTLANALPDGKNWSDYKGINFDICFIKGESLPWGSIEIGVRADNGEHTKFGSVYDENGEETAAWGECTLDTWMPIELSIKDNLVTDNVKGVSTLYIRLMKNNMEYLLDNVTLVPISSETDIKNSIIQGFSVVGVKGETIVTLEKDMVVSIVTIDGKQVLSQRMVAGKHNISLPAGLYIINKNKVVVY